MRTILQAEAPGSLMLFGEHAVLRGHLALVCAVDRRLRVRLTPREDARVEIHSELGTYRASLGSLADAPRLRFVLAAVADTAPRLPGGFSLEIDSDLRSDLGLGSSAAVTVATLAALRAWAGIPHAPADLLAAARAVIRSVQGAGSGADAAASIHGSIVAFRAEPLQAEPLGCLHPITAAYAGAKTPTAEVIQRVDAAREARPALFDALFALIGRVSEEAASALRSGDSDAVGALMNLAQGLMEALGVCNARLAELVYRLRGLPGIGGAKISGAGLGDCAIGWGRAAPPPDFDAIVPLAMTPRGLALS